MHLHEGNNHTVHYELKIQVELLIFLNKIHIIIVYYNGLYSFTDSSITLAINSLEHELGTQIPYCNRNPCADIVN